jgi:isopenicillin N synthase-like dioxygenase
VPVIDLSPLTSKKKKKKSSSGLESSSALTQQEHDAHSSIHNLVEQVGKACEEWGFFQVINHGVSLSLLEELETNAQSFFALPLQEKAKVRIT